MAGSHKISIVDLLATKRKEEESILDFITRWCNLNIKCEQSMDQSQVVGVLIDNLKHWMAPLIFSPNIKGFDDLISQVNKLQRMPSSIPVAFMPPKTKKEEGRRGDSSKGAISAAFVVQVDKEEQTNEYKKCELWEARMDQPWFENSSSDFV